MTVFIVSSKTDIASITIKKCLLENSSWNEIDIFLKNPVYQHTNFTDVYLITMNDSKIHHENIDKEIIADLHITPKQIIFISRHTSKMATPSLTVHPIGNYGEASFGGRPKTLVPSSPQLMTTLLRLIYKNMKKTDLKYQVCFEVTHHGPYLETPTLFVEVGSTKHEWKQTKPAKIIANSVIELLNTSRYEEDFQQKVPILVGFGGGHYAPRFTDVVLEKNAAFGHMIPSYQITEGNVTLDTFQKALQATPNANGIYMHKKALKKSQVTEYKQLLHENGINVLSSKELPNLV